jgi:methylmalonyl-CoA mutase
LFNLIAKEYDHKLDCHLLVTPTKKKQTIHIVNMLRTTECRAILGADAIANLLYDALYHKDNEFEIE